MYRIDGIEVDPGRASLRRSGLEHRLRAKTFSLLLYLLEHRGRVVTREELLSEIWPGTAVSDDALTQCVGEIRRAFNDDPREARYLRTVPKQGFLFIGPVVELSVGGEEPAGSATMIEQQGTTRAQLRIRWWVVAAIAVLLVTTGWIWSARSSGARAVGAGKTSVAIFMFENRTGRQDLEWMEEGLPDMLLGSLARSPKLSILSREQILEKTRRARTPNSERMGLEEAIERSRRMRAQVLIMGAYAVMGDAMRLELRIFRAMDGQLLGSEVLTVSRPEELLTKFDGLAVRAAAALRVPLPSNRAGIEAEARTSSLEAYRLYILGVERSDHFHETEAIALFERAVALDPKFYMASARIGYTKAFSEGDGAAGLPYLEKAIERASSMSERDRLFVEAWLAFAAGRIDDSMRKYQQIIKTYPEEITAYVALGRMLRGEQRHREARDVLRQGLVTDPDCANIYNVLSAVQFELGDTADSLASALRFTELAPEESNALDSLGITYHRMGRYQDALKTYQRALTLKPDFAISIVHMGNTFVHLGRYREALAQYRRFVATVASEGQKQRGKNEIALVLWKRGDFDGAIRATPAGAILGLINYDRKTGPVAPPSSSTTLNNNRGWRNSRRFEEMVQGYTLLRGPDSEKGLDHTRAAIREQPLYWSQSDVEECLADAFLSLNRLEEAIAEYKRVLGLYPNLAVAHYGLGLALARKGDAAESRSELRKFVAIWNEADRDLPQYQDAIRRLR